MLNLFANNINLRSRKIDFVNNPNKLIAGFDRKKSVGDRLRLNPLRSIDNKQSTLACRQRTRYLIVKINMTGSIDQVEHIIDALILIMHSNSRCLNGDPPLTLKLHAVKELFFGLTLSNRTGYLKHTVSKRTLAMINMRHNRKITNMSSTHQKYLNNYQ